MKNSSKSWAEVTTPSKYENAINDWPDLSNQNKSKTQVNEDYATGDSFSDRITNLMERLSTNETEQKKSENRSDKSRDEIRDERKLRRKEKKLEKNERIFQERLAQIREPKTQKVKLVDQVVMETYLANRNISCNKSRRSKFKNNSAVKVDLVDLINAQLVKPIDRSFIQSKQTTKLTNNTQRHKGKKREYQKKKYVSKLKRSILLSRLQRNPMKLNESNVEVEPTSTDIKAPECNDKESLEEEQKETSSSDTFAEITSLSSTVKFSRKFRPYCDNFTIPELLSLTEALLRDIFRFQDRAYNKNEVKARSQKRFVVGFKETMRQLDVGKVKLLIIAPDLELSLEDGGINDTIDEMKRKCQQSNVPYVFSLKRRQLGYVLLKKVPVSCVGVINYQGSEDNSQKLLQLIEAEKVRFQSALLMKCDE